MAKLEDIAYKLPEIEFIDQNTELLQEIVDQNKVVLEINKQVLAILANPMVQCSYDNTQENKDINL